MRQIRKAAVTQPRFSEGLAAAGATVSEPAQRPEEQAKQADRHAITKLPGARREGDDGPSPVGTIRHMLQSQAVRWFVGKRSVVTVSGFDSTG